MSQHLSRLIPMVMGMMFAVTSQSQEPLVIPPAKISQETFHRGSSGTPNSAMSNTDGTLSRGKYIDRSDHGANSWLCVFDLESLEKELLFHFGRFAHKGRMEEDKKKIEYDYAKVALGQYIKGIWDPINANAYADEYRKRNKGRLLSEYFKVIAAEKEQIARGWFESLQENKRYPHTPDGVPPGQPCAFIADSGMYAGSVTAVSPDGSFFYCWERDYSKPVETRDGYWIHDLKTEQRRPSAFKFRGKIDQPFKISPDGKWGVVRSINPTLTDPITGEIKKELEYPYHIEGVFFSDDSRCVAAIGGETYVWEVGTWKLLGTLDVGMDGNMRTGFFKDSKMLRARPQFAAFSPSGRYLFQLGVTAGLGHLEKYKAIGPQSSVIWDIKGNRLVTSLPRSALLRFEGWGPTDDLVFLSEKDHLALVHLPTGKTVAKLMQPPDGVSRILPLVDSTHLPFRTLCRASDGLVLSEYMRQDGKVNGMKDYLGYLIRWDLGPHMNEIQTRIAALSGKP